MKPKPTSAGVADARPRPLAVQQKQLWALAYRLTGCAADADDVVQETLARWLERSSAADERPPGPWMVRVATNLAIDVLRARRRRAYAGPWLPSPVAGAEDDWLESLHPPAADAETRYGRVESVTMAFLTALEELGPRQRATLLLRDVLGYSPAETATVLDMTEGNVRVLHLRARRAMATYDRVRCVPTAALRERHRAMLERFLSCLAAQDVAGLERLLADSVRTSTDSAGEYSALRAPLGGRAAVARFYVRAAANRAASSPSIEIRTVNGLPTAILTLARPVRRQAPFVVLTIRLDDRELIDAIHTVLAPGKLTAVRGAGQVHAAL